MKRATSSDIFVNARFLTQRTTGVQRYAIEISKRLKKMRPSIRFLTPKGVVHEALAKALDAEVITGGTGPVWEQLVLPKRARGSRLINMCNSAPLFYPRQIVVVHDAAVYAVPGAYSRPFTLWYRTMHAVLARGKSKLLTVSQFSRTELCKYLPLLPEDINIVSPSAEHIVAVETDESILDRLCLRQRPFLLAVGSRSPHKNFERLNRALSALGKVEFETVVVGLANRKVHAGESEAVRCDNLRYVGFVSDAELAALYAEADAFIHPAYYEGFGIPPIEAMVQGCPVICSQAASLPEICQDAAIYFDPFCERDIRTKVTRLMSDSALRVTMRERGLERAAAFSWENSAEHILEHAEALD